MSPLQKKIDVNDIGMEEVNSNSDKASLLEVLSSAKDIGSEIAATNKLSMTIPESKPIQKAINLKESSNTEDGPDDIKPSKIDAKIVNDF